MDKARVEEISHHPGSYSFKTEMRRSVYQKKFYSGSVLYAEPPKKKPEYQRAYHSFIDTSTNYPFGGEEGAKSLLAQQSDESFVVQPNYERYSCSGLDEAGPSRERPFRSEDYDNYSSPELQCRLRRGGSGESQDSDIFVQVAQSERSSSGSGRKKWSEGSRQSSENSEGRRRWDLSVESDEVSEGRRQWLRVERSVDSEELEHKLTRDASVESETSSGPRAKLDSKTSQDSDEMNDLFASKLDLAKREGFHKERSMDSDETSGFVSKHSSETTDFSSKLSSSSGNFAKHSSEPLGFASYLPCSSVSQHFSEPGDFVPTILESPRSELNEQLEERPVKYGQFLEIEKPPDASTGAISKQQKRERFRKSKRIKHFNLRRIDDTDNDSSCDSDRYLMDKTKAEEAIELAELPSARLKEEVGLPKHLSRESSCDRYGLYKSKSEKTITSFESDRFGASNLHDFESFCDAVMFSRRKDSAHSSPRRVEEVSTEDEMLARRSEETPRKLRKSKSKRDLSHRLKCLLL